MRVLSTAAMIALCLLGLSAAPAGARRSSVVVDVTAHLVFDYRWSVDFVDTSFSECTSHTVGQSHVSVDMLSVTKSTFRLTRYGNGVSFEPVRAPSRFDGIELRATMQRTGSGSQTGSGASCPKDLPAPLPTNGCGARSWLIDTRLGFGADGFVGKRPRTVLAIELTGNVVEPWTKVQADHSWQDQYCGNANGDAYDTQTQNPYSGVIEEMYEAPSGVARLFAAHPRTLVLHHRSQFPCCGPDGLGIGDYVATHDTTLTLRKR